MVRYIKRHRFDSDTDSEQLVNLIMRLKDVVDTIYNYGEFTIEQKQEQEKYLLEQHKEWVKLMEEKTEKDRKQSEIQRADIQTMF